MTKETPGNSPFKISGRSTRFFGFLSSILTYLSLVIVQVGCKQPVKTYENNMGIEPGVIAQIDTAGYTSINWKDTIQNFGKVQAGEKVLIKFSFENSGKNALFLTAVNPSCGCVVADYPRQAIMPGDSGSVTATFDSKFLSGVIRKSIWVTSNTMNGSTHLLSFAGQVVDSIASTKSQN